MIVDSRSPLFICTASAKGYSTHSPGARRLPLSAQGSILTVSNVVRARPTLDPPGATSDEAGAPLLDEDYLVLSTIHSAKGQEWKSVFVLNTVDGCMPSDLGVGTAAEIEEEICAAHTMACIRYSAALDCIAKERGGPGASSLSPV
jgi:hypothetical protein